jgi:hypothetical protein
MLAGLDAIAATSEDVKFLRDFIASSKEGVHGP